MYCVNHWKGEGKLFAFSPSFLYRTHCFNKSNLSSVLNYLNFHFLHSCLFIVLIPHNIMEIVSYSLFVFLNQWLIPTLNKNHVQYFLGFLHSSVGKESACNVGRPWLDSCVGKIWWRRDRLSTPVLLGFPCGSAGKESACNVGDLGLIPGLGRSPGKGKSYPLQYSGLENSSRKESDMTELLSLIVFLP